MSKILRNFLVWAICVFILVYGLTFCMTQYHVDSLVNTAVRAAGG